MSIKPLNQNYVLSPQRMYTKLKDDADKESCVKKEENKEKDIFHNSPLRYFGYSDDIGAAIRTICSNSKNPLVKSLPKISFIPAGAYIAADVASVYNKSKNTDDKKTAFKKALGETIFQGMTNILFPILTVGISQKVLGKGFDKFVPKLKQEFDAAGEKIINRKRDILLTLGGLGTLFALSKPVDNFNSEILMKKVVNPILNLDDDKTQKQQINSKLRTTQA